MVILDQQYKTLMITQIPGKKHAFYVGYAKSIGDALWPDDQKDINKTAYISFVHNDNFSV